MKWLPWKYQVHLIDLFQTIHELVILKARQLGISWLIAAYALWMALFHDNIKVLILSQGETEAWELVKKARYILNSLPDYMRLKADSSTRSQIVFNDSHSEIKALPSTDRAGKGYNATLVIRDELAEHPEGANNYNAISPSIDSGGTLIDLSTIKKNVADNHFTNRVMEIYNGSVRENYPSGLSLFSNPGRVGKLVFISWKERPVRDESMTIEEWFESRVKPKYTQIGLEENYPSTIEDAIRLSLTKAYFDHDSLEDMGADCCAPIKQSEIDTHSGIIRVYKIPDKSRRYVVFTDPSDGVEDPFVTGVMDFVTGEVVCTAYGKIKVDYAAAIHDYLVRQYIGAVNSYEYNAVGMAFAQCLKNLATPNQAPRRNTDGVPDYEKTGQFVSERHKQRMFADLANAIAKRQVVIHDREFMQQAKMVTRDNEGFPVTQKKLSFDWVMMMNGLWQLQKHVPRGSLKATTLYYDGKGYSSTKDIPIWYNGGYPRKEMIYP